MTTRIFRDINYSVSSLTGNNYTLKGTEGNDWIEVLGSNNVIQTGKGDDVILVNAEFVSISDYFIYGGPAIIFGGIGLPPSPGGNTINTGMGNDYVAVVGGGDYTINLGSGKNLLDGAATSGNIRVLAGSCDDIIDIQGIGNYKVYAQGGNNKVYLGAGNAFVKTDSGDDVIVTTEAGIGAILSYIFPLEETEVLPYKQEIRAGSGNNQIEILVFGETNIITESGNDFVVVSSVGRELFNTSDDATILTKAGNDTVITLGTDSLIKTGAGHDVVISGIGNDTIYAGAGNDIINLRGIAVADVSIPSPINTLGFVTSEWPVFIQGGGNDTVYLQNGHDQVILGSNGFATIYGFGKNDLLDVTGLDATFTYVGSDTLICSGDTALGVLKGYTAVVGLV